VNSEALHTEFLLARDGWIDRGRFAAEMQAICDDIKARNSAKAAAIQQRQPVQRDLAQVRAEYERELVGFDPTYIWSEYHSEYKKHEATFKRICALSDEIDRLSK